MATDFIRAINTRFPFASGTEYLKLASYYNSPDHSTKGTPSHLSLIHISLPENEAGGSGEMELHFRLREPSEGMARIETELNRRSAL